MMVYGGNPRQWCNVQPYNPHISEESSILGDPKHVILWFAVLCKIRLGASNLTLQGGLNILHWSQVFRSGGQSEAQLPVLSSQASLVLIYRPTEGMTGLVNLAQPREPEERPQALLGMDIDGNTGNSYVKDAKLVTKDIREKKL
ncbi:hypothetical protein TNCV_3322921 [Trichonephila clavipes]|nr:hypothetical protein TNCV_3322921 [Trichonephila clavipes]